jgi:DNA modification methylase
MARKNTKIGLVPRLETVYRPIAWFQPYERNPRKNDKAVDRIRASIREFGFAVPMLARSTGEVIDGHLRLKGAIAEKLPELPVVLCDGWSDAQVKAFRLMVNRSVGWADWDVDALALEFADLKALDFDVALTGFDSREIDAFTLTPNAAEDDVPPVPEVPITKPGDLWLLGPHRLLCGDSTLEMDVLRLMDGISADMVFTDPPYGVGYDGGTTKREKLKGDQNTNLYAPACEMAALHSKAGAALYLWHAGVKGIAAVAAAAAAAAGYEIRCELVWNKNLAQFGSLSAQYKPKHEPCYYCFKRGHAPAWYGPKNEVTVWDCNRASKNKFHPTQKPVEIVCRALTNSSKAGDVVLDFFGGSGSTLIGCDSAARVGFILEIDPGYCDVIRIRWENLTGKKATLEASHG